MTGLDQTGEPVIGGGTGYYPFFTYNGSLTDYGGFNNWSTWDVGSRLQWNVSPSFYVGADVSYQQLISAATPGGVLPAAATLAGSGATTVANQSNWTFTVRAHKDFLP